MQDVTLTLTPREQEAIAIVCDLALKHAGNSALNAVVAVHQAMGRAQAAKGEQTHVQSVAAQ